MRSIKGAVLVLFCEKHYNALFDVLHLVLLHIRSSAAAVDDAHEILFSSYYAGENSSIVGTMTCVVHRRASSMMRVTSHV
jgi:hypothetical protein